MIDRLKIFEYFKQDENKNSSLKKYLDLSRFSMAIDRKINDDNKNYKLEDPETEFKSEGVSIVSSSNSKPV